MSDMQSMDRENKKRQLRQNIVQMPDAGSDEPMDDERLARYKKKKRIIAVAAACFLAALGFTGYRYMNEYEYTSYSVQWERSMRYTDTSNADKETQAPETSAAADEGTDGTDETAAETPTLRQLPRPKSQRQSATAVLSDLPCSATI